MRKFKNPNAIRLIEEAQALEKFVATEEQKLAKQGLPLLDYYCELLTEAAGLRVQADELECGEILYEDL